MDLEHNMERKLATIAIINDIRPIEGADFDWTFVI